MASHRRVHALARRLGTDVYHHMAGGRRFPLRLWRIPSVPPLVCGKTGLLAPFLAVAAAAVSGFEIELEHCTSFVGFSYSGGGWNPHVATLEEFVRNPALTYEQSSLYRLHQAFVPTNLQELFVENQAGVLEPLGDLPPDRQLFRYVWAISPALITKSTSGGHHDPAGHHYFGPMPADKGEAQFARLIATYQSIEREGFQPDRYGPIMGYFLADDDSYRFVVGSGNHRLAALKVLGHTKVRVALTRTHPAVVHRSRLDTWTVDQGGPFQRDTAYALFDKLLSEDGMTKARNLGLVGPAVR